MDDEPNPWNAIENNPWIVPSLPVGAIFAEYDMPAMKLSPNVMPLSSSTGSTNSGSRMIEYRRNRTANMANDNENAFMWPVNLIKCPKSKRSVTVYFLS